MVEENKRLVRRVVHEVWNWKNLDLIDELIAPDYVRHDPAWPDPIGAASGQSRARLIRCLPERLGSQPTRAYAETGANFTRRSRDQ